jgi:hypothetical protein
MLGVGGRASQSSEQSYEVTSRASDRSGYEQRRGLFAGVRPEVELWMMLEKVTTFLHPGNRVQPIKVEKRISRSSGSSVMLVVIG